MDNEANMQGGSPARTQYPLTGADEVQIARVFTYHSPKGDQPARYEHLRDVARGLARDILGAVPPGRERALAMTKLEECVMWANAGIARGE